MIKVTDVAFVRFAAPDLDSMERFACDFGLVVSERRDNTLYCRGTDPEPYLHVSEVGEAGFRGVAFDVASAADLKAAWHTLCGVMYVTAISVTSSFDPKIIN